MIDGFSNHTNDIGQALEHWVCPVCKKGMTRVVADWGHKPVYPIGPFRDSIRYHLAKHFSVSVLYRLSSQADRR